MNSVAPRQDEGFDVVINGVNRYFADLELSAIASAGFYKDNFPEDTVQIRTRADGSLRTVLGPGRLQ
jgi:hypothetical protein